MRLQDDAPWHDHGEPITREPENTQTTFMKSRGHIVFDSLTPDEFRDLVIQTLEESDFIKVTDGTPDDDRLVIINEREE